MKEEGLLLIDWEGVARNGRNSISCTYAFLYPFF